LINDLSGIVPLAPLTVGAHRGVDFMLLLLLLLLLCFEHLNITEQLLNIKGSLGIQSCGAMMLQITALVDRKDGLPLHTVAAVGPDGVVRVDPARHHPDVQVVLGAPVVVRAGAQAGHRHLVNLGTRRGLLH